MTTVATIATARDLFAATLIYRPTIEDGELVFATDPPAELAAALSVLHTGVRAVLTGRGWWGSASDQPRVVELNPAARIPPDISLLCVEGDGGWDRLAPDARTCFPHLFAPAVVPSGGKSRKPLSREHSAFQTHSFASLVLEVS